jgi:formylglycine-generating enzyme required for sulfatase activity
MKRIPLLFVLLILTACSPAPDIATVDPPDFIDTGVDYDSWAVIPAGEFPSGQHDHMTDMNYDYQIMITDVTNEQYARFLNEAVGDQTLSVGDVEVRESENVFTVFGVYGPYPGEPFDGYEHEEEIVSGDKLIFSLEEDGSRIQYENGEFSAIPEYANHPATMMTWFGANAYCSYYGWRLPLELEWEKAARGTSIDEDGHGLPFPWGYEIERNQANYYSSFDLFEKVYGKLGNTTPVGLYNGKAYEGYETLEQASPYGLYDMAGNVWQWTGDDYPKQHYRHMRGGSFYSYEVDLRVWKFNSAGPTYFAPDVGFRCASDQ